MGGLLSSRERNKFGESLFISSKLRNACWMLSSIPDLRTLFIQYLKDKKWVSLYLDSMHVDLDDVDENISMAVKYNFPPELLDLFPGAETFLHNHMSPQASPLPTHDTQPTNNNAASVYAFDEAATEEINDKENHPSLVSIQSSLFVSTSSLLSHSSFSNSTVIQSAIQQELKLLIIAGILLIFVESMEYKYWIRHHMSLVTFSELCQQELEQSWRSIRSNFIPKAPGVIGSSHRYIKHHIRSSVRKKASQYHSSPRRGKIFVSNTNANVDLLENCSSLSKKQQQDQSDQYPSILSPEEEELHKQQKELEDQRLKRKQRHQERIKKMIFAALSIPFAGGQSLKHVLVTSDWLDSLIHFLQFLPVGVGVSSSSAQLYNREKSTFPSSSSSASTGSASISYGIANCCCQNVREDCPILYVNRHVEKVTEVARDDIVGRNLCHFLAMQYQQHRVPCTNCSSKDGKECHIHANNSEKKNSNDNNEDNDKSDDAILNDTRSHLNSNKSENAHVSGDIQSNNNLFPTIDTKHSPVATINSNANIHNKNNTYNDNNKEEMNNNDSNIQKDVILRKLRASELRLSEPDRPLYFTFRLIHRDGLVYWHLIKCLPIHHATRETGYSDAAVNPETSINDNLTSLEYSSATSNCNATVYSYSGRHVQEYSNQNNNGAQRVLIVPPLGLLDVSEKPGYPSGGVFHILSTHIILPDLSQNSSLLSLHRNPNCRNFDNNNNYNNNSNHYVDTCHRHCRDTENSSQFTAHNNQSSNMYYANSQSKTRFTQQDMEQLARDLQMIDDFLLVLSVLFQQ